MGGRPRLSTAAPGARFAAGRRRMRDPCGRLCFLLELPDVFLRPTTPMPPSPCSLPLSLAASLLPLVAAQEPPPKRGQRLVEITRAAAGEYVGGMASTQNGAAPTRSGALFVPIVRAADVAGVDRLHDRRRSDLELWRSDDGGLSWRKAASTPTDNDCNGVVVPDGELLSVLWCATGATTFGSVFWQRYDPRTDGWIGAPVLLAAGASNDDQFAPSDLVRTPAGALVAVFGNRATARAPAWNCSWSTGMRWLAAGAEPGAWAEMVQVNVFSYGCAASAMGRGELVDISYRTNPNQAIHGLRTFDASKGTFVQESDQNVGPEPGPEQFVANIGVLCVDGTGGRSLLHLLGDHEPGKGRLAVSWSRPGEPLRTTTIAEDPVLKAGNENPQHFTLARGPGNQVFAYFSKQGEDFANLWQCVVEEGRPMGEAKVVARGAAKAFAIVSGMRCSEVFSGLHVVTTARAEPTSGGVVSVFGSWPARSVFAKAAK